MEYGLTMPVVPKIEMPPTIPSRAFKVCLVISWPCGTEMVTSKPTSSSNDAPTARTLASILRRGTGLMAGPPTARPSPGMVTVPTPKPPHKTTFPGCVGSRRTSAVKWALSVQSGSSPASLMTMAWAVGRSTRPSMTVNVTRSPLGKRHSTVSGTWPVTRPMTAARAAAAEHAPVVKPVRVPRGALWSIMRRVPAPRPSPGGHGWPPPPEWSRPCDPE